MLVWISHKEKLKKIKKAAECKTRHSAKYDSSINSSSLFEQFVTKISKREFKSEWLKLYQTENKDNKRAMQKKSERYRLAGKKKIWNPQEGWILKGDFETLKKEQRLLVNGLLAKAGWSDGFRNLLLPDCEQETPLRRLPPRLQLLRLDPPRLTCQGLNIRFPHEMKEAAIKVN